MLINRREFCLTLGVALVADEPELPIPEDLKTPFKLGRLVFGPSGKSGSFDELFVDAPFVFRHQGKFYMTYVGFDGEGYQTGLASSSNLIDWKREGLILGRDQSSTVTRHNAGLTWILRENDVFSSGELRKVNGRFLGGYHAYPESGLEVGPAAIGLCWSDDLYHWDLEPPCLRAQDGEAWERAGLYKACILEHAGTYYLFYNAKNQEHHWIEQTGFAFSRDLKKWVRYAGNPVIRRGGPGSAGEKYSSDPCVLRYRDQWAIFYFGLNTKNVARDLLALSPDLRTFTKCRGVLVDVGPKGSIDSTYAHKPSIIAHKGTLYHFYVAVSPAEGHGPSRWREQRGISVATSRPL